MYPNTFQHVRPGVTLAATLTGLGALAAGGSPAVSFNPDGVGSKLATATDTFSDASTSAITVGGAGLVPAPVADVQLLANAGDLALGSTGAGFPLALVGNRGAQGLTRGAWPAGGVQQLRQLGACRTWGVDSEKRPQRGQFLPDLQAHSSTMGQKAGKKWTAEAVSQPTFPKPDRLLDRPGRTRRRHHQRRAGRLVHLKRHFNGLTPPAADTAALLRGSKWPRQNRVSPN